MKTTPKDAHCIAQFIQISNLAKTNTEYKKFTVKKNLKKFPQKE